MIDRVLLRAGATDRVNAEHSMLLRRAIHATSIAMNISMLPVLLADGAVWLRAVLKYGFVWGTCRSRIGFESIRHFIRH